MRCKACDAELSDFESTRKIINSEGKMEYPDLCTGCFNESELPDMFAVVGRSDLSTELDEEDLPTFTDYE